METEIDFTMAKVNKLRMYGGVNGNKICVVYNDENYMLKFPPKPYRHSEISYTNGCISEHVACRIFEALGIETQKTLLGLYGDKIIVACRDFEANGFVLKDFAHLKNTIVDSAQNGYGTELSDVLDTIHEQQIISPVKLEKFFWNMFVVDALLGNFDRHNGNWGFLINESTGEVKIAPVYDCGSCLYPQLDENGMEHVINNRGEIEERIFIFPNSALKQKGVKINYAQFLAETDNEGCLDAIRIIRDRIDLQIINKLIDDVAYISDMHKAFLKIMIKARKEQIIDRARLSGVG